MQLVEHLVLLRDAGPVRVSPVEIGIDHHGCAVIAVWLAARCQVRQTRSTLDAEPIAGTCAHTGDLGGEMAIAARFEIKGAKPLHLDCCRAASKGPEGKTRAAAAEGHGTEGFMTMHLRRADQLRPTAEPGECRNQTLPFKLAASAVAAAMSLSDPPLRVSRPRRI